jgi:hypothetical protein
VKTVLHNLALRTVIHEVLAYEIVLMLEVYFHQFPLDVDGREPPDMESCEYIE